MRVLANTANLSSLRWPLKWSACLRRLKSLHSNRRRRGRRRRRRREEYPLASKLAGRLSTQTAVARHEAYQAATTLMLILSYSLARSVTVVTGLVRREMERKQQVAASTCCFNCAAGHRALGPASQPAGWLNRLTD